MNSVYRDLILTRAGATVDAARALTGIKHHGLKGQLREIVIRNLLLPLLPSDIGLGTGEIISYDNNHSKQQDIVLFDRSIVPPILLEGTAGVFPAESVLATIEIKSKLTAAALKSSHASAKHLRTLPILTGEYDEQDAPAQGVHLPIMSTILAFDSDLTGPEKNELERLDKICNSTSEDPLILMMCVIGRGCWMWKSKAWSSFPINYPMAELVAFVAVIMNSYRKIADSRRAPRMGYYVL